MVSAEYTGAEETDVSAVTDGVAVVWALDKISVATEYMGAEADDETVRKEGGEDDKPRVAVGVNNDASDSDELPTP